MSFNHIILRALLVLCVGSGGGFLYLYKARADLYAKTEIIPASLGELYPVNTSTFAIAGLNPKPQAVKIIFSGNSLCTDWIVKINSKESAIIKGASPTLPLQMGTFDYTLTPQNCSIASPAIDAVRLNIFFAPKETFGVQNVANDQIQLNRANIPVLMEPPQDFARWIPDVETRTGPEAQAAKQVLLNAGFDATAPLREQITFITTFVRDHMPDGTPDERLNSLTPYTLFTEGEAGRAKFFCRQWSLVYGYFANAVGIPTRNLFTGGAMGTVDLGSHAFSESYLADEGRWAYVDPTNDISYLQYHNGHVLSGADVYMAAISDNLDDIQARMIGPAVRMKSFRDVSADVVAFMHRENFIIYIGGYDGRYQIDAPDMTRYAYKLWRFIAQPQQYFGYTPFTSYHWLRPLSFFTALVSGALFALSMLIVFCRGTRRR
ncbi:MAG: transglutaminase-like domain-containing protein [Rhodospirillales bacterium]|nr:transglutaminase-like domain-containing protein [Rhodospirillales bacterium]